MSGFVTMDKFRLVLSKNDLIRDVKRWYDKWSCLLPNERLRLVVPTFPFLCFCPCTAAGPKSIPVSSIPLVEKRRCWNLTRGFLYMFSAFIGQWLRYFVRCATLTGTMWNAPCVTAIRNHIGNIGSIATRGWIASTLDISWVSSITNVKSFQQVCVHEQLQVLRCSKRWAQPLCNYTRYGFTFRTALFCFARMVQIPQYLLYAWFEFRRYDFQTVHVLQRTHMSTACCTWSQFVGRVMQQKENNSSRHCTSSSRHNLYNTVGESYWYISNYGNETWCMYVM